MINAIKKNKAFEKTYTATEINQMFLDKVMPVGSIYLQLRGQAEPNAIWGGGMAEYIQSIPS